ncbi:NAD(P)-dependent alcohol dehydrogenase (plasmid) [Lichenicola cladoniae]|uniref:NAD(P)-dependent alcohol dehydrogenase n=2 Tax=Lichenicola cladoniae TaxID=1484109 RepID=A0A6M8HZ27_9PROT|nr:NAD(P)-dependent alcohol dehydrogenase [Acetobacteraceae bacterium]QKE93600.1 NAD(P)-dependent alcohol dehydrogenase [Lichenicola cladoniae]
MDTVVTDTFFLEKFADRTETVWTRSDASQIVEHHGAPTRAYGALYSNGPIHSMNIDRRARLPDDVAIDILYCGVCHSDIHMIRGEWGEQPFPMVPGHEFVGRVSAVGQAVTRFSPGDFAGVGCMVDSCKAGLEQYCTKGTTVTYASPDPRGPGRTYGGYAERIVVRERFVVKIPDGADLAFTPPLLCSGITTFSPMQHWRLGSGQRFAVIGLGGLGHTALKLAVHRGAKATVFTTSADKAKDAYAMGAKDVVVWQPAATDPIPLAEQMANRFNFLLSTIPLPFDVAPFLPRLRQDDIFVNVGAPGVIAGVSGGALWNQRRSIAGSCIGGMPETQEVVDYCSANAIRPQIELIRPDQIDESYLRVERKDVRYRFVIDLASDRIG